MKGVNAIENANDPGKDGIIPSTGTNPNLSFAKDLTAFSLEYFNNDYKAINSATPFASVDETSPAGTNSSQLFNGNIRYMQTRLTNPTTGVAMPMLNAYKYDQLNRLLESRSYENSLSANKWNPIGYTNEYFNRFSYDAMGNILHQDRHLRDGTKIENMTYQYQYEDPSTKQRLMRNRLYHINDDIASSVNSSDIDDMGTFDSDIEDINVNNNYAYDEEGRLVKDVQEGIQKIEWTVTGKVKKVIRVSESEKKYLTFDYDAFGQRIAKHVYNNETNMLEKSTYYILDAQGNQMSMYEHVPLETTIQYNLVERNIYGNSRVGTFTEKANVLTATYQYSNISQSSGLKFYEFTNHLGNVLSVFSDTKIPLDGDTDGEVDEFKVQIVSVSDYSPFGVQLDGRSFESEVYRRGFNGMEKDDDVKGSGNSYDFGARFYDSRVGRFLSRDPREKQYPYMSVYCYAASNPIKFIDVNGEGPGDPVRLYFSNAYSFSHGENGRHLERGFFFEMARKVQQEHIYKHFGENGVQKIKEVWSGSGIVNGINSQAEESIQSIDMFSHANNNGLWFYHNTKNTPVSVETKKSIFGFEYQLDSEYAGLYSKRSNYYKEEGINPGMLQLTRAGFLDQIDISRFKNDARIELHGCETAG
jgi:RHS repeat-associated protein